MSASPDLELARRLRDAALADTLAYELTAAIGTELGPRLDRKSTRLNPVTLESRMPSSA